MADRVLIRMEGVRNLRRGEDQQRRIAAVDSVIQIQPDAALNQQVHLKKTIVAVGRGVSSEELGQALEGLLMDVTFRVATVIDPANMDIRNCLNLCCNHCFVR
jgi:hypothetical protein